MKHLVERMISAVLAAALVFCTVLPVWAEDYAEESFKGVKLIASLDRSTITESNVDQKVTMTIGTSRAVSINYFSIEFEQNISIQRESVLATSDKIELEANDENNVFEGRSSGGEEAKNIDKLVVVTFIVPANTKAGRYEIGLKEVSLSDSSGGVLQITDGISIILTVDEKTTADGYTAGITAGTEDITVDGTAEVFVSVKHTNNENFAAGEMVLTYDNERLTFNKNASTIGNAAVKDESGVLTIEDYGEEKTFGNSVYKLAFTPKNDGPATVTLNSAAFVNKTDAAKRDLIPATISSATASFTVAKRRYTVTLPEDFTGATEAVDGEKYTFRASDYEHYDYTNVTATVGGNKVTVTDDGKGNYTIEAVNGIVEISGTRTPKKYNVTFEGNAAKDFANEEAIATYGKDYSFTVPTVKGWTYKVDKITINNADSSEYEISDKNVCTIYGEAIVGDVRITVSKKATTAGVTINGTGASDAKGEISADIDGNYTLTLKPEEGYVYTITAMMGNQTVNLIKDGDTYKIEKVTGDIVFTVTRTVITENVSVTNYLGTDGNKVRLVLQGTKPAEGKVPTYDGTAMFWSNKYKAYCYLVMAQTLEDAEVKSKIGIIDGTAKSVDYGKDVNMTGTVDASDAQLVYNMYNADYSAFTEEMTMEKFLRADVNGDKVVNTEDAVAIIHAILDKSVPQ